MPTLSLDEVTKHNKESDCWIVVDNKAYNVTKFLSEHPGGKKVLLRVAGKDATEEFKKFHNFEAVIQKYGPQLYVGTIGKAEPDSPAPLAQTVPYGDPSWYQGWSLNHYYSQSHANLRNAMRTFLDKEISPFCFEWDEKKALPKEIFVKCYKAGWLPGVVGFWPTQYAGHHIAGGVKPEEFDVFHELIILDELSRCGSGGVVWGLMEGLQIGLPPVLNFGSEYLRNKVVKPCVTGEKVICLCITEPSAGSDVAGLATTARKTEDGKYYIVNGEKKWITNGTYADYFTVAVRTGGSGMGGISLLVIERSMLGVSTRHMQCSGMWASGTAYVTFEDVKVPVENLVGEENKGFKYIMFNFNHERWGFVVQANRFARVCLEEAFVYAHKRKTFGKRLVDHPVIRMKLAHMIRQIEATHAWLESSTQQLKVMKKEDANVKLGGSIALLKAQASQTMEYCAREASQIFGGLAYPKSFILILLPLFFFDSFWGVLIHLT
eukprot:Phypoly_transcript_02375.p1 GENE.Phypoly_transcript_02375~~Phypoly_transcript_02375.p1  ORF type:complete len:492 (+),score=67.09 Phypoly_transcript_02375:69-1544(+)